MGIVERIIENARKEPKRIVLPEPEEPRMLKAATRPQDGSATRA
ncbi:MAG: phosphate acyltransferase [Planctomycetota bacterium]